MGLVGEKLDIDFVISTGDNFYEDGLRDVEDPAFEDSFTNIYTSQSLNKKWYSGKFTFQVKTQKYGMRALSDPPFIWFSFVNKKNMLLSF